MKIYKGLPGRNILINIILFSLVCCLTLGGCSQPFANQSVMRISDNLIEKSDIIAGEKTRSVAFSSVDVADNVYPQGQNLSSGLDFEYGQRLYHPDSKNYLPAIRKYANIYNIDWLLVYAVIEKESRFDNNARSYRGAYGLMQIMPSVQTEISDRLGINEVLSPSNNIKAGIYYLKTLYNLFKNSPKDDRIPLTLAAYNAGIGRILDAQKIASYLGNDPTSWACIRDALKYMSKRYYTLHDDIWGNCPPSGYFNNPQATIDYVENIMKAYDLYSLVYPGFSDLNERLIN